MSTKQYLRQKYKSYKKFSWELIQAELLLRDRELVMLKLRCREEFGVLGLKSMDFEVFALVIDIGLDE